MNRSKFEYSLNAILYCIWLNKIKFTRFIRRFVNYIAYPISRLFVTKEYRKTYYKRLADRRKRIDKYYIDKKRGACIHFARFWFRFFYSGYTAFFSYLLLGITYKFFGALLFPIPIALGYIPAHKAVFSKDRYLEYFKLFEKEDEVWQRKWSRITTIFIIGGIIMALLGIAVTTLF